jgi:hypothetical protein
LKGLKRRGYNEEEIFKIGKQVFPNLKIEQLKTNGGRPAGSTNKPKTTA